MDKLGRPIFDYGAEIAGARMATALIREAAEKLHARALHATDAATAMMDRLSNGKAVEGDSWARFGSLHQHAITTCSALREMDRAADNQQERVFLLEMRPYKANISDDEM